MRINEILVENEQLDEISMAGVGQAIGRGATAAGKAVGATASGAVQAGKNFWQGMKQGWTAGRDTVAGNTGTTAATTTPSVTGTAPAQGGSAPAVSTPQSAPTQGGSAPATSPAASTPQSAPAQGSSAPAAPAVTVGQINKVIPTLRTRDLQSVKKTVDATIAKKGGAATPTAPAATAPAPSTGTPNLQVQPGGKKKKPAATPSAPFRLPPPLPGATMQAVEESVFYSKFLNMKL